MRLKILFLLFAILAFHNLYSQQKPAFSGKITDAKTGEPLSRTSILVHDANTGTISDDKGYYKTAAISPGTYVLEVSHTGYESIVETVTIDRMMEKNFKLMPAVVEVEGVTVTGVSTATRLRQLPQPVRLIKRNELLKFSATNIINSISHIPGVSAATTGPAISKPFIRGLGYNRVVTVNDGVRQEGQQWGDEHGIEIDDYSVQQVEVLKGPASLVYGSDALAGVINIRSLLPVPEGIIRTVVLSEYQSNNKLRGFYGNVSGTKNGFSLNAYAGYKGAADYKNKMDGPVFNSKFYNINSGGMLGYRGTWGHSYLHITNFDQQAGIIEGNRDNITGQFVKTETGGNEVIATHEDFKIIKPVIPFQHIRHFKITTDNSFNLAGGKLDLDLGFQRNQRQEFGNPDKPDTADAWFDLKTMSYAARFNLPYKNFRRTSVGITGMAQTNSNLGAEAIIPEYNLFDAGAFVFKQYQKDKLTISGGFRFDYRHVSGNEMMDGNAVKFKAFTRSFSNISGSAGLSYLASEALTLKFNIARGFRAPSLAELSSNGAHEGTERFETGDLQLKSETSFQFDGGLEMNTEHISLSSGFFYNNIQNFIFYEKVLNTGGQDSIIIDPGSGNPLRVFRFNGQDAYLYGLEFNMDIHPHPLDWLHFENTISFTTARFKTMIDGTKNVPMIPGARYIAELKGNFLANGKSFQNFYVSLESDYTFRQSHPFSGFRTETATGSYWLLNATLGTEMVSKGKTIFSIHLSGMNLANVVYQSHLSRLKYTEVNNTTGRPGVYNPGSNFGIKINVPLDFNWK